MESPAGGAQLGLTRKFAGNCLVAAFGPGMLSPAYLTLKNFEPLFFLCQSVFELTLQTKFILFKTRSDEKKLSVAVTPPTNNENKLVDTENSLSVVNSIKLQAIVDTVLFIAKIISWVEIDSL